MSGPVQPPLTVETVDGATVGRPITKIKVTNGTLAVSGSTATLTISGGGGGSGTVTSVGTSQAFITITDATTTPSISIGNASGAATGVLTAASFNTFDAKQDAITLTTTGTSGAATFAGGTLNIPQYSGGSGAPTDAEYITLSANGSLTNERVITAGTGIGFTDGGAGSALTIFNAGVTLLTAGTGISLNSSTGGVIITNTVAEGTITGSITDNQIAVGATTANELEGSANLTFDGSNLSVSGYIKSGAGLVTAPTYTFTAADDVGMYLTGTNILHFTAGNSDLMNLQHDGTATNVRLGNGTGGAALSSKGLTNLTLQTNDGVNSGTIVIEDSVNGQISITPNGTGTIKLDGVELDNTAIATGYVLKATSATEAGWAAESGGVTFPLEGSDGSAGSPTYSFSSASNLGFFKDGSTAVSFTSGGTRQMSFDANGVIRLGGSASNLSTYSNNLVLDTDLGSSSGSIVIEAGANGQIAITPNGTGTIKLDGVELDNSAIATGYVLKATSATQAGWAAESGGGGSGLGAIIPDWDGDAFQNGNSAYSVMSLAPYGSHKNVEASFNSSTAECRPFVQPRGGVWQSVNLNVSVGSGSTNKLRVGIYNSSSAGTPTDLLGYADLDTTSSGSIVETTIVPTTGTSVTLTANTQYWLACVSLNSVAFTCSHIDSDYLSRFAAGATTSSSSNGFPVYYITGFATNSLDTNNPPRITAFGSADYPDIVIAVTP